MQRLPRWLAAGLLAGLLSTTQTVTLAAPVSAFRQPQAFGANVRMNQDTTNAEQNETAIAVSPQNPRHVVAGANDFSFSQYSVWTGVYNSTDGGQTWHSRAMPAPTDHHFTLAGDPGLAFDNHDHAYYSGLYFNAPGGKYQDGSVYVAVSPDGGVTWPGQKLVALGNAKVFHDMPSIAVDKSSGKFAGAVYLAWDTALNGHDDILFSYSDDGGQTYARPKAVASMPGVWAGVPAVGPDGTLYVSFIQQRTTAFTWYLVSSTDGGRTFTKPRYVTTVTKPVEGLAHVQFRVSPLPRIGVAADGSIILIWADRRNGDADIFALRSTDRGQTWKGPVRINDDKLHDGKDQFFGAIATNATGKVAIIFYDRRNDPRNTKMDLYAAISMDDGATFGPNQRVTNVTFNPNAGGQGGFYGDYISVTIDPAGVVHPAWTDSRRGQQDVYTSAG